MDWSTSYAAGSSSHGGVDSSDSDSSTDTDGRYRLSRSVLDNAKPLERASSPPKQSRHYSISSARKPGDLLNAHTPTRREFTRSRSPAPHILNGAVQHTRSRSPAVRARKRVARAPVHALPARIAWSLRIPCSRLQVAFAMDTTLAVEAAVLLGALGAAAGKLTEANLIGMEAEVDAWLPIEMLLVVLAASVYIVWIHTSISRVSDTSATLDTIPERADSPRPPNERRAAPSLQKLPSYSHSTAARERQALVFMTVPKNYRDAPDDGIVTGLVLGPLISAALFYNALTDPRVLPGWHIEPPMTLPASSASPAEALIRSRATAIDLGTLCSAALLLQVGASAAFEARFRKTHHVPDGERGSVPRSEMRKAGYYVAFVFSSTLALLAVRIAFPLFGIGIWTRLSLLEIASLATFFQFSLYIAVRLAHHALTLGELTTIAFGATALFCELAHLTLARLLPGATPFLRTFRLPTPLLTFQIAMVPGSLLTGFLLSPLLALSRHIARQPLRRLKNPLEKERQRKWMAFGFYVGTVMVVFGLIGSWARWILGARDPWLWALRSILDGPRAWTRPALLAYWGALGSLSVAGWNRQLARSHRLRLRPVNTPGVPPGSAGTGTNETPQSEPSSPAPASGNEAERPIVTTPLSMANLPTSTAFAFPDISGLPSVSAASSEWLDAADRRVPTLGLNGRRKFFHLLAVLMFVPGVAVDPAFTHLAISAAFALFAFAEFARYFALWPVGAAVHVFVSEFLDAKDMGAAVLSHFYLLTGCGCAIWFEAPSPLLAYTGILTVGVGDAIASIYGKRFGRIRWTAGTPKTVEGSLAFTLSVAAFAGLLYVCGVVPKFSAARYIGAIALGSVLEGVSGQNDNVVLPVYVWSLLALCDV
ncbi:hypothetical protein PENSPDRAFT_572701 [Peniophora sp. CONT]|nr:hypothetical protein PENSPDRAFT_572701 [Peniophora sp. CONT]